MGAADGDDFERRWGVDVEYELTVLRAMARLQRKRATVDAGALLVRAGGTPRDLRNALRALERAGWIVRTSEATGRLTLPGLAIAVSSAAARRPRSVGGSRGSRASRANGAAGAGLGPRRGRRSAA